MVYIPPVPDWLEQGIREAEGKDILDRLFAKVMINAVDLRFFKCLKQG
jgi:hypothetical protein